jgi:ATP/maltotriose-dependent transcriptional regulator MalT
MAGRHRLARPRDARVSDFEAGVRTSAFGVETAERQMMPMATTGSRCSRQIGSELYISLNTVKGHVRSTSGSSASRRGRTPWHAAGT